MQILDVDELENLITEHLLICEVEGKSPFTLMNYRRGLHRFLSYARTHAIYSQVRNMTSQELKPNSAAVESMS